MQLGAVNCFVHKTLCDDYKVSGVPAVFIFKGGAPTREISERTAEGLIAVGKEEADDTGRRCLLSEEVSD